MEKNDILKMEGKEPKRAPARRRSWLGKAGVNYKMADRIQMLYLTVVGVALGAASVLGGWTQDSLCTVYLSDAVYLSIDRIDDKALGEIASIALTDAEVRSRLDASGAGAKFINCVLPAEWYISEISLHRSEGAGGHYTPGDYNRSLYKVAFTGVELADANKNAEGRDILSKALRRTPVAKAWIDLSQEKVIEVKNPPASVMYEGIPVPIY
ncbi:MAG: hypothetical protein NTY37_03210 [Methanothrix sp.]|nr:hypothetical protein [Methanothrix sp.]